MEYLIYVDVAADIDPAFARENRVGFVPMHYSLGEEELICREMESPDRIRTMYESQRQGKLTSTSQVTPHGYMEIFSPFLEKGISILYLSLSSGLTKTYDSACLAAQELDEAYSQAHLYPFDTLSGTGGIGLLAEEAVKNREKGMSIEENIQTLTSLREHICHIFMVEDLMYLRRGGRISSASALIGTALKVKPILMITPEGSLTNLRTKRGDKATFKEIAAIYGKNRDKQRSRAYIVHGDNPEGARKVQQLLQEINPEINAHLMPLGPIVGAHTGPGMVAVLFFGDRHHLGDPV